MVVGLLRLPEFHFQYAYVTNTTHAMCV